MHHLLFSVAQHSENISGVMLRATERESESSCLQLYTGSDQMRDPVKIKQNLSFPLIWTHHFE